MAYSKEQRKEKDPGTGYSRYRDPVTEHQKGDNRGEKIVKGLIPTAKSSKNIKTMRWEH